MICKGTCGLEVDDVDAIDGYCIFDYPGIIDFETYGGGTK